MLYAGLWCSFLFSCSESELHGLSDESGDEQTSDRPTDTGDPGSTGWPTEDDDSGWTDTEDPGDTGAPMHLPETCSTDTMVHMAGTGPQDCPDDHAAYMMDDGSGPNFVCCPLPATDILSEIGGVERGNGCAANEVITGFSGQYAFRCTLINLGRYQIGSSEEPCYFGSGSSGGSGVSSCSDHPHTWDVLQQSVFGSDGCSGYPYGSLFVSQTGKDCEDMRAVQLYYNGNVDGDPVAGTPVDMFRE